MILCIDIKINGVRHHCNNEVVGLINFEGRGPRCCLMRMTGDVTKIRLSLFFNEETMFGAITLLKRDSASLVFKHACFKSWKQTGHCPRTEDKVPVRIRLDNSVYIIRKDKPLLVKEIPLMFEV
jgi:hypothetical protein